MTRLLKKRDELNILRLVFKQKRYPSYIPNEKPDFILGSSEKFGVEITEYYPDSTGARLHKVANYAENIINKTYIHKDDKDRLNVVTIEYQNRKTGKWKKINTPAVVQENLPINDRLGLMVNLVATKSKLYDTYDQSLSRIDLIINDSRNSLLDNTYDQYVLQTLNSLKYTEIFLTSKFANIFLTVPAIKGRIASVIQLK